MNRREFISYTSAGLITILSGAGCRQCLTPASKKKSFKFRPYRPWETFGKVTCVTPADGSYIHTFYDVCPFSPSHRYLAVTKFSIRGP
ncbi:MAG: hypothetical protein ACYSSI_04460 [Planctomycetota bacterium]|jgi:hypothetical protein